MEHQITGSASTAQRLRTHPTLSGRAVRFTAEADSLDCSILGPDARPGTPEFDLYVTQLVTEMTVKAGQKCTAIRRAFVPSAHVDAVVEAVRERLAQVVVGNPANPDVHMGALAGIEQREEVRRSLKALRGACVGAGLGFALASDLRVAAAGARFATAFAGIGFGGDSGLSASLAHAVGVSRATELLMLGEPFTAEQACDCGIVREVVAAGELEATAHALAARLAAGPTRAYAEMKQAIATGAVYSLPTVMDDEAAAQARLGLTEDHRDAVEAFLAKREPEFRGR